MGVYLRNEKIVAYLISLLNITYFLSVGRVDGRKGLPAHRVHKLVIYENLKKIAIFVCFKVAVMSERSPLVLLGIKAPVTHSRFWPR